MRRLPNFVARFGRQIAGNILAVLFAVIPPAASAAELDITVNVTRSGEAFVVDTSVDFPVPLATAWEVLTDFDHMSSILGNLSSSKVLRRDGQILTVRQEGAVKFGILSFSFESEREIRLDPMQRIQARQLSGTTKRMESDSRLTRTEAGARLDYRAEIVPDSVLARMFGATFVRHEVREQFRLMAAEMKLRQGRASPEPAQPIIPTR